MKEKGEALLETVLIAPIMLMIGLLATEYGALALNQAKLSERIRSVVNAELLNIQNSDSFEDGRTLEQIIERNLKELPNVDRSNSIEVNVNLLKGSDDLVRELPFLTSDKRNITQHSALKFEVRVKVQSKALFISQLKLPALVEVVRYRLRA